MATGGGRTPRRPPAGEGGEAGSRHGDRGWRDWRPRRAVAARIARALVARGHRPANQVELFGSQRGQEATTWPPLEFPFTLLRLGLTGYPAECHPGRSLGPMPGLFSVWCGRRWRSFLSCLAHRPRVVVVAVGGYASFPAGLAALVRRRPHPPDAGEHRRRPRRGERAAGAVRGGERGGVSGDRPPAGTGDRNAGGSGPRPFDRSGTGRREARAMPRPARRPPNCGCVRGGSLGARRINAAVADLARLWSDRAELSIYHVTGRRDYPQFARSRPGPEAGRG